MSREQFVEVLSSLNRAQHLQVLKLVRIVASWPEARAVIRECNDRGLDLEDALAELSRRLPRH
jgi:hypothetical protein